MRKHGLPSAGKLSVVLLLTATVFAAIPAWAQKPFVHPGLLHARADLERIKRNVKRGVEPWKSWNPRQTDRCTHLFRDVLYPVIKDFATFANGNWDTGCIKTMMDFGVFLNDRAMFERAVDYYYHGSGNGALGHYILPKLDGQS